MKILEIWRYPVKSMQGESRPAAELTERGITWDRVFAVRTPEGRTGSAKNPARFGRLFECRAWVDGIAVKMALPAGGTFAAGEPAGDAALSEFLGESVRMTAETPESPTIDYEDLDAIPRKFDALPGTFFDTAPVHVLSTGDLAWLAELLPEANLDLRRFRPNLLVDAGPLAGMAGETLRFGDAEVRIDGPCPRCIMTTLAQPGGIPRDADVLRTIARELDGNFGALGRVTRPGSIVVG